MKPENKILIYRLVIIAVFSGMMSIATVTKNYVVAITSFIILIILSIIINKKMYKTQNVVIDERDNKIAGKSAFWAIRLYTIPAAFIGFVFVIIRDIPFAKENNLYIIGETLSISVCMILILYSVIFKILRKKGE